MFTLYSCFLTFAYLLVLSAADIPASDRLPALTPHELRCEYLADPLGIDIPRPRLSWVLLAGDDPSARGLRQTAYRVLVASSKQLLDDDKGDLWDSGKVASDATIQIEYAGKPLQSRMNCIWKVRAWDANNRPTAWSKPATWTMGLLDQKDWQVRWIGAIGDRPERTPEQRIGQGAAEEENPPYAALLLRKEYTLSKQPARAIAHICGLGYYEMSINGQKVGDSELDPGFTDYTRRVLYASHDVTDMLHAGPVAIGVILGAGWYDTPAIDDWKFHMAPWIAPPQLLLEIDVEYADGSRESLASDETWKCSPGPIVFNSLRGGETYDARKEKEGWDKPGYNDSAWANAKAVVGPQGTLEAQQHPPIRATQSIRPAALSEPKPGIFVFNLGVNIAGWARLQTRGQCGQIITMQFNELLNPDGTVKTEHLANAGRFQTDQFILKGKGIETFEPRFTYHGFQYVQVTGLTEKPSLDSLTGRCVHTAPEVAGEFSCSNPLLNKLQKAILRTQLNNLHGIPTDCPHREKIGWTADGSLTMEEAIYNFDMAAFYAKWIRDMFDAQDENGHAASVAPSPGYGRSLPDGSPPFLSDPWWGSAIVRAPWLLYRYYGDRRILAESYPAMTKYLDYVGRHAPDYIAWPQEGDWMEEGSNGFSQRTPPTLTSTVAYFYCSQIMGQVATILGKSEDAVKFAQLAEEIRTSFNRTFGDVSSGLYAKDSQTAQAMPLYFGMVPDDKRNLVADQLIKNITVDRKNHISSGIVGLPYVFGSLAAIGREDISYAMVTQEDYPGWGNMLRDGGTTIWESWNGAGSRNHPAFGSVGAWFYQSLAGIRLDPETPGFKKFIIKPAVVGDLTWVKCYYNSIHGRIVCNWKLADDRLTLSLEIPANTTATVFMPTSDPDAVTINDRPLGETDGIEFQGKNADAAVIHVSSGCYQFAAPWHK